MSLLPTFSSDANLIIIIHVLAHSLEEMDGISKEDFPIFILVNQDKKALKRAIRKKGVW